MSLSGDHEGLGGSREAIDGLLSTAYEELRRIAEIHMRREYAGHTLQATALVHEAFLRLADQDARWNDRAHFCAVASQAIRRILVDHARSKGRAKRGGDRNRVTLHDHDAVTGLPGVDILDLEEALEGLAALHARQARIVELRFFGGLTMPEIAEALGVSVRTVEGDWRMARAWLRRELTGDP